ncbi:hypothetical protein FOZ63_004163, partial [Perkinsus olseni]
ATPMLSDNLQPDLCLIRRRSVSITIGGRSCRVWRLESACLCPRYRCSYRRPGQPT